MPELGAKTEASGAPFTAIVLAADRDSNNPVASAAGVPCKAFCEVGGRAMVLRVLDTLAASRAIGTRILSGPGWSTVEQLTELREAIADNALVWVEHSNSPSSSASAAMATVTDDSPILLTTADHPLLSTAIVDYFCAQARGSCSDVLVGLISHDQVSAAYPGMKRTRLKFRDGDYCGCNLFAFMTPSARSATGYWQRVEGERKNPLRLIRSLGWTAVLRYLTGRLGLTQGLELLSMRTGVRVDPVLLPFAEAAVDVDSVTDWSFAEKMLSRRNGA